MRKVRFTERLPARNPAPLATPEALNQSWSIDFMHDALMCGRHFRTFNVVDDFNLECDYNRWRRHSACGGLSPEQFENQNLA